MPLPKKNPDCVICLREATGFHFGVLSCDGCKAFFRRSVRSNRVYVCSKSKACSFTKEGNNGCRYCRYRRCFQSGMRKDAIRTPRGKLYNYSSTEKELADLSVDHLLQVDLDTRFINRRVTVLRPDGTKHLRLADAAMLCAGLRMYIVYLWEWASRISCFESLTDEDKVILIQSKAVNIFILELAYKSMRADGVVLLFDRCVIPTNYEEAPEGDIDLYRFAKKIVKELVNPMEDLQMDDREFNCVKAVLLFDPDTEGLSTDVVKIRSWREKIQENLMGYLEEQYDRRRYTRFAEILLRLLPLKLLSSKLDELVANCADETKDSLVQEVLWFSS